MDFSFLANKSTLNSLIPVSSCILLMLMNEADLDLPLTCFSQSSFLAIFKMCPCSIESVHACGGELFTLSRILKVPDKFFSALLKMYWTSNQDTWILTGLFLIYYDFG